MVYYNEIDPFCVEWLRKLISAGHLPRGDVDETDIRKIDYDDLLGRYNQCHFFAGIGGWPLALMLAKWPQDQQVWTGSCPCQPFSSAAHGKSLGIASEKHLWPIWKRLIEAARPSYIFGEQVAQSGNWFDDVCDDLETMDYQVGAAILPACSIGKDHKRERIYFAGYSNRNSESKRSLDEKVARMQRIQVGSNSRKNGISARVGRLRAYGNAIVPQVAAEFVKAIMECIP